MTRTLFRSPPAPPAGAPVRCPSCSARNPPGTLRCRYCRAWLAPTGGIARPDVSRGPGDAARDPGEQPTSWWARRLDRAWSPRSSPPWRASVWFSAALAVLGFTLVSLALVQAMTGGRLFEATPVGEVVILGLPLSLNCAVRAWRLSLLRLVARRGLRSWSWSATPSLAGRVGSQERRWLAQWRLATVAEAALTAVVLLVTIAYLAGAVAHAVHP
ncbi:MAG: hypothetical protein JOZ41_14665 [Chloroflexi bacterium]|nr:hypothetical protein [Chloroflexota bacterium]